MTSISSPPSRPCQPNFDVVIPTSLRRQPETAYTITVRNDGGGDDDELSDETVSRLVQEAEQRLRSAGPAPAVSATGGLYLTTAPIKLPRLDPGASLPKPPIALDGVVSRITDVAMLVPEHDRKLANNSAPPPPPAGHSTANRKSKKEPSPTAGAGWYDLPRTEMTDEFKRDYLLIKHRNVLDPHRHYRKDRSGMPQHSHVGTVVEASAEFFNARINRRDRKKTILDEILADGAGRQRFKRKYAEIQAASKSGKKEFYRKLKERRNKDAMFSK